MLSLLLITLSISAEAQTKKEWDSCEAAIKHLGTEKYRIAAYMDSLPTEKTTLQKFDEATKGEKVTVRISPNYPCPKTSVKDMPVSVRNLFIERMSEELDPSVIKPELTVDKLLLEARDHIQKVIDIKIQTMVGVKRASIIENLKTEKKK